LQRAKGLTRETSVQALVMTGELIDDKKNLKASCGDKELPESLE
jgi:hypothetical protein